MGTYTYKFKDYPRVCDFCAVTWNVSQLVKKADGRYACPDCKHLRIALDLDRLNAANMAKLRVLPRKDVKEGVNVNIYQEIEAELFKVVVAHAPYRYLDVTSGNPARVGDPSILTAAESIRALYDIVQEGKRPAVWRTQARTVIGTLADWLLQYQFGSPTGITADWSGVASTATYYGSFYYTSTPATAFVVPFSFTVTSEDVGAGGLALIYAYNLATNPAKKAAYRTAALNALYCLRLMQCGDKRTTDYTTRSNQGTDRYHVGMWTHSMTVADSGEA